ncbi:MAG: hypothetical protein IID39_09665, partial [Planctomycetes bacterium]|nr:hypothetical protein [Planctomycetota bacterium]
TASGHPDCAKVGTDVVFATSQTCFYAEQGGQVGDTGVVRTDTGEIEVRSVTWRGEHILHHGTVIKGEIYPAQECKMAVDSTRRRPTMKNHTSTHLLNWALREVLGGRVEQKGSLVDPEKTRFDFSHRKPVTGEELARIESLVNERIEAKLPVYTQEVEEKRAREINTLRAVFGEKYPDIVRVVSIGADIDEMLKSPSDPKWMQYSVEFCGGTHLKNTSEAERFVLITEEAVAKGIRRVVGITGEAALAAEAAGEKLLAEAERVAEGPKDQLADGLASLQQALHDSVVPIRAAIQLREKMAELQKVARKQQKEAAGADAADVRARAAELLDTATIVGDTTLIVGEVPQAAAEALRGAVDWFRQKTASSAVFLACHDGQKVTLLAGMSRDVVARGIKAGDLIKAVAPAVGGRGGGRPDMAQGGGNDPTGIGSALEQGRAWLVERLG